MAESGPVAEVHGLRLLNPGSWESRRVVGSRRHTLPLIALNRGTLERCFSNRLTVKEACRFHQKHNDWLAAAH